MTRARSNPSTSAAVAWQKAGRTINAWLCALEARAHTALGDTGKARAALDRAEEAREHLVLSDLDEIGGLLTFAAAQQAHYRAETLVLADTASPQELEAANQAVAAYHDPDDAHWAFGDEAGSRTHQALAMIAAGEFDGASESLEPVLNLPPAQRTHGIAVCVQRTLAALPAQAPSLPRTVGQLRDAAEEFDHTTLKAIAR